MFRNKAWSFGFLGILFVMVAMLVGGYLLQTLAKHQEKKLKISDGVSMDNLPVLWDVPAFSYLDQHRQPVTDRDLQGHVWIADFIFTQCTAACPMMTAKMVLLQRKLAAVPVKFLSFSVDPEHDTPEALHEYAHLWNADESRWTLLSTDAKTLPATAAGMRVDVERTDSHINPILHSELFVLIDQRGKVRGYFNSGEEEAMARLVTGAKKLAGPAAEPSTDIVDATTPLEIGKNLVRTLGCTACHDNPRLAPPLGGLFSTTVKLDNGATVVADDAYLRESIVDPNAKVVAGYARLMPAYGGVLSPAQIDALTQYIKSLPAPMPGSPEAMAAATIRPAAIDPVCLMKIVASNDSPHVEVNGKMYYFCSENCRNLFAKNTAKYVAP